MRSGDRTALQVGRGHECLCSRAAALVMPRKLEKLSSGWSAGTAELINIGRGFELIVPFQPPARHMSQ